MSISADGIPEAAARWVTFSLQGETYGIDVMQVQEVLRLTEIVPVPGGPAHVRGIINLRGQVVTVLDSHSRLGLAPREPGPTSRILIAEAKGQTLGILVDSVSAVVDIRPSEIETAPSVGNREGSKYIRGVYHRNGQMVILMDLNRLVPDEEWGERNAA